MKRAKRDSLENAGWKVGSTEEFLGLSPEESAFIQMKLALARHLRVRRQRQQLTQIELADRLGSSQSRVAKMEAADSSVSLDLLVRSILALGASAKDVAKVISTAASRRAA